MSIDIIPPDEVERIKKQSHKKQLEESAKIPEIEGLDLGNKLKLEFESNGRFSAPPVLYATDYKAKDLHSILTSRNEDMLETIANFLEKSWDRNAIPVSHKNKFTTIGDLTIEELFEFMVGLKIQFDSVLHNYRYLHTCQKYIHQDKQKYSQWDLDLSKLSYRNISECDNELKEHFKEYLKDMDKKDFENFCISRYGEYSGQSKKDIIDDIKLQEPISILDNGNVYKFRLQRFKDVLYATRRTNEEFSSLIRSIQNKKYKNLSNEDESNLRQDELEKVSLKKSEKSLDYMTSMMLLSINDRVLETESEKLEVFKDMDKSVVKKLGEFLESMKFGIDHEQEIICDICSETEIRRFPKELSPAELLIPYIESNKSNTKRKLSKSTSNFIYFGV
jgi:hypothetical protein